MLPDDTDLTTPVDRRDFLTRASALSMIVGGTALVGCSTERRPGTDSATAPETPQASNANSRLDTALAGSPIRGVQTWDVPPGGGMCFELQCDVPGEFPFVNHGFGHGQKGAIGFLVVES